MGKSGNKSTSKGHAWFESDWILNLVGCGFFVSRTEPASFSRGRPIKRVREERPRPSPLPSFSLSLFLNSHVYISFSFFFFFFFLFFSSAGCCDSSGCCFLLLLLAWRVQQLTSQLDPEALKDSLSFSLSFNVHVQSLVLLLGNC